MIRLFRTVPITLMGFLAIGCSHAQHPMSTFAPKSDLAHSIFVLYWEIIGWDTVILLIVAVTLLLAIFRYSTRAAPLEAPVP